MIKLSNYVSHLKRINFAKHTFDDIDFSMAGALLAIESLLEQWKLDAGEGLEAWRDSSHFIGMVKDVHNCIIARKTNFNLNTGRSLVLEGFDGDISYYVGELAKLREGANKHKI